MESRLRLRVALAALTFAAGTVALSPSFVFDSDRDGVGDSIEIFERGSDPAKPNAGWQIQLVGNDGRG